MERKQLVLTACYLALVATLLYLLFQARTPIARTIWATFDPSNLIVYLAMTFVLLVIIISRGMLQAKLALIIVHSTVALVFKQIVFASRFGYDTWISLGWSTYIFRGEFYSLSKIPFMVYSNYSLFSKIYHVTERVNLYSQSVILARMFSVDVYWTHLLLVSLLWGIFMPVLTYKVTKFFFKGEAVPLLAALLSCILMGGTTTISYLQSWVFLFLIIYLSLGYVRFKRGLLLLIILAFVTFLTHELIGMLSVSVILLAVTYTIISDVKHKNVQRAFLFTAFIISVLSIPYALLAYGMMRGGGPSFSLKPLENMAADKAVFFFIFDQYANMTFREALISGIIPFLGLLGLGYTILKGGEGRQSRKASVFMLLCFILAMIDYRIMRLFMVNLPGKVDFSLSLRELLAIPFAAIVISSTMNFVSHKLASGNNRKITAKTTLFRKIWGGVVSINFRKIAVVAIFVLSISSLATLAVYSAYPQWTEAWWTTAHELEAARYIEENTSRNETYVVLCDVHARLAGYPVVGPENPRAYYYGPYESRLLKSLYQELVDDPSMGPILAVREKNDASIVFVIINTIRTEVKDGDRTIAQMMNLPHSELFGVFGEDVYVFEVRPPRERMIIGVGPAVFLYNNQTHLNTTLMLDIVTYEASYNLSLTGLTNYNITSWPMHWSFENVTPIPYLRNVDADNWINFTGREDMTYMVWWKTNVIYQPVGWKDDSFKIDEWRVSLSVHWEEQPPQISTDGDILSMTGIFQRGIREGYHITRDVPDISTDEYPYAIVKWRSTGTCAGVAVKYDDTTMQVLNPTVTWHYAQYSRDWKVSIVKLPEGKTIKAVRLALDDYPSWTDIKGTDSVYFDYIMFSNITTPQL